MIDNNWSNAAEAARLLPCVAAAAPNLLCAAVELVEDIKERNLRDDELLLLVLVQRGSREVKGQEQEGGLGHLLLIFVCDEQSLLLLWRLQIDRNNCGYTSSGLRS